MDSEEKKKKRKEINERYYKDNREKLLAYGKAYRDIHAKEKKAYNKIYQQVNKKILNQKRQARRNANADEINAKRRKEYALNRDKILDERKLKRKKIKAEKVIELNEANTYIKIKKLDYANEKLIEDKIEIKNKALSLRAANAKVHEEAKLFRELQRAKAFG